MIHTLTLCWSSIRFRIVTMKLHHQLNQLNHSQKSAFVAVFVILFPFFIPNLFQPLGRASPSIFSVTPHFPFPQLIVKNWISFMNHLIVGIKNRLWFQEWIAPKPRHVTLLQGALQRRTVSTLHFFCSFLSVNCFTLSTNHYRSYVLF